MTTKIYADIYSDTGCDISPSCLNCPLRQCKYDDPGEYRRYKRGIHTAAILDKIERQSLTVRQTAIEFAVTERTIYRILAESRPIAAA